MKIKLNSKGADCSGEYPRPTNLSLKVKRDFFQRKIAIIATLDSKGEEVSYLKELISRCGHKPLIIDVGSGGEARIPADITAHEVARAGGAEIEEIRVSKERRQVIDIIVKGAVAKLSDLCQAGEIDGIISLGGLSSAVLASSIMERIPWHIPKLIVSSAASMPNSNRFFGPTGITMMHYQTEGQKV